MKVFLKSAWIFTRNDYHQPHWAPARGLLLIKWHLKISSSCARKGVASPGSGPQKKNIVASATCWVTVCCFFTCLFECILQALPNRNSLNTVVQYDSFLSWDTAKNNKRRQFFLMWHGWMFGFFLFLYSVFSLFFTLGPYTVSWTYCNTKLTWYLQWSKINIHCFNYFGAEIVNRIVNRNIWSSFWTKFLNYCRNLTCVL